MPPKSKIDKSAKPAKTIAKPKKPKKPATELAYTRTFTVARAGLRKKAIYLIYSPVTGKIVYVGQSFDLEERVRGHLAANSGCTMLAKRIKEWAKAGYPFDPAKHLKLVPELPKGVPESRANEFECYFIDIYDTTYNHLTRSECCNQTIGNHASKVDAKLLKIDIDNKTVFPKCDDHTFAADAAMASLETVEAITMLEEDEEEVPVMAEVRQNLQTAIIAASKVCEDLQTGAFAYLEEQYEKLEGKVGEMPRSEIQSILNVFKEKVIIEIPNDARGADDDILRMVKDFSLFASSDDPKRQAPIRIKSAHGFLQILVAELEHREILAKQRFYAGVMSFERKGKASVQPVCIINVLVKSLYWTNKHGTKPSQAYGEEERKLAKQFDHWKNTWNKPLEEEARQLFRHHPKVIEWMDSNRADKGAEYAKKANALLLKGHKHRDEPFAEGKTFPHTRANKSVCAKMYHLILGCGSKDHVEILVAGLPEERASWYRNAWASKEQEFKAQGAERSDRKRARKEEATGKAVIRRPRKKRKVAETEEVEDTKVVEGEGSASAETKEPKKAKKTKKAEMAKKAAFETAVEELLEEELALARAEIRQEAKDA